MRRGFAPISSKACRQDRNAGGDRNWGGEGRSGEFAEPPRAQQKNLLLWQSVVESLGKLGALLTVERLEKIRIKGFKSINDLTVEIRSINVLIGGNGSGKSNFIGAFTLLQQITEGRLSAYVKTHGGADQLLHFGMKKTKEIRLHAFFNDSVDQYEISLEPTSLGDLTPIDEVAYFWKKNEYSAPYRKPLTVSGNEAAISRDAAGGVVSYVKAALKSWRVYHFHDTSASSPMKQVSDIDDNRFLRSDGSNIASVLYRLKMTHEQEYKLIRNTIRRIAPFFDDFVLEARALDATRIRLEWRHNNSDAFFDVSSFSDGTLRFIALATLLMQPKELKPSIILLDEPELGLHPSAITVLGAMIRTAAIDAQIIISTQSPMLLDLFEPEEVIVVERDSESTKFSRLNSADLGDWLSEYSLGELWEKNELGGKPKGS